MEQKNSLFGPLLLIGAGVTWLLVRSGTIPSSNLWALTFIWPFLIIAAGVGLILRSYWAYTSILMDVLIIGATLLAILYAPQLGWNEPSALLTFGWEDENAFVGSGVRGSGNVISETRDVSGFDSIRVDYPARVLISQGNEESLTVEAEDNLLPGLKTEVRGNELRVYYSSQGGEHVNPTKAVTLTIMVKELNSIDFSSAGEVILDGLDSNKLNVSLDGAGNIQLNDIAVQGLNIHMSGAGNTTASGTTDNLNIDISGFGGFNGKDLQSNTVNVTISGAGGATVWVDEQLDASISGAGSVRYYGSPQDVSKQVSGLGAVTHVEK